MAKARRHCDPNPKQSILWIASRRSGPPPPSWDGGPDPSVSPRHSSHSRYIRVFKGQIASSRPTYSKFSKASGDPFSGPLKSQPKTIDPVDHKPEVAPPPPFMGQGARPKGFYIIIIIFIRQQCDTCGTGI